jgi:hypothetical protein
MVKKAKKRLKFGEHSKSEEIKVGLFTNGGERVEELYPMATMNHHGKKVKRKVMKKKKRS